MDRSTIEIVIATLGNSPQPLVPLKPSWPLPVGIVRRRLGRDCSPGDPGASGHSHHLRAMAADDLVFQGNVVHRSG